MALHQLDCSRATLLQPELATVLRLVAELRPGVVNVGHGRDPGSVARAEAFVAAFPGLVGDVVSWPATAASWLRPAARLAGGADAWVVADTSSGWARIGPRLADDGRWRADRTVAFAPLADATLPRLAAADGLRGATHDGGVWHVRGDRLRT